jgi:DeoR family glycerol-3-phosphate regulon repressor
VILVADSTKFRRSAPVRIGHISQVQTFVTDRGLPAGVAKIAQDCSVTVIEAIDKAPNAGEEPGQDYPQAAS